MFSSTQQIKYVNNRVAVAAKRKQTKTVRREFDQVGDAFLTSLSNMYGPTLNHVSSTRIKRTHNQKLNKYLEQIMKTDLQKTTNRNLYNKRFFREFDVLSHIKPNDFWVILNRRVLDLSNLVKLIDELPSNSKDSAVCACLKSNSIAILLSFYFVFVCACVCVKFRTICLINLALNLLLLIINFM